MATPHPVVDTPSSALSLPDLTPQDISNLTDQGSFGRGRDYRRQEAIRRPIRRGRTLSALCRGGEPEPYQVRAVLADPTDSREKIASFACTCPRGGFCKHIVALLLTWIEDPDEFEVLPTTAEILADTSREELLHLIDQMIEHEPSLESLVDRLRPVPPPTPAAPGEAPLRTINQAAFRRKVARALEDDSYGDGYDSYREYLDEESGYSEAAANLREFVVQGEGLQAAGRIADAVAVLSTVAEEAIAYEEDYGGDAIGDVILDCGIGLLHCLEGQAALPAGERLEASDRTALVESLYNVWKFAGGPGWGEGESDGSETERNEDVALEAVGYSWRITTARGGRDVEAAMAAVLTEPERNRYEGWLRDQLKTAGENQPHVKRDAIRFLFKLRGGGEIGDEALLEEYKQAELWEDVAALLLRMGRIDDAVALAGRQLATPAQALGFADRLRALGDEGTSRAIRFVDGRLWETEGVRPRDDLAYVEWLIGRYTEQGQYREAFAMERRRFKQQPAFRHYEAIRQAALSPGLEPDLWQQTRPQLIEELTKDRLWGTLIEIHLHEEQVGEAIAALKEMERPRDRRQPGATGLPDASSYYAGIGGGHYRASVARAAERDYPEEAIRLYRSLAESAIEGRNRQSYATAATFLVAVRNLMEKTGREAEWREVIAALRTEHSRLRALKEELDALGLR